MNVTDTMARIKRFRETRPKNKQFDRLRNIFYDFKDGANILRLVGSFLEVKTHFISPAKNRGSRGLCVDEAFRGDHKLPPVINCPDWDLEKEQQNPVLTCPICRLHRLANEALEDTSISQEDKDFLEDLESTTRPRTILKWNILDRDDPFITRIVNEVEEKVLGYKIANIGMEAWGDIEGIFDQCQCDITDVDGGIDICVTKTQGKPRTSYSAQAVIAKLAIKVTPLTQEEKALELHNLRMVCGKMTDIKTLLDALHGDLREMLDANPETATTPDAPPAESKTAIAKPAPVKPAPVAPVAAPAAAPVVSTTAAKQNPAPVAAKPTQPADDALGGGDDGGGDDVPAAPEIAKPAATSRAASILGAKKK